MSRITTFRKPWKLLALCLPFFFVNLVGMNVMPFAPDAHWLGVLFFRVFWLVPLIGTIVCLRDAYNHRLRISDDAIELNTPQGPSEFRLHNPNFTAHWKDCPDRLVLKSRDGDTTIRFHDYKSGDKIEIIALLKEKLPEAIQSEWEAFQSAQEQCSVRAEESAQRLRKYGPLMLLAFAGLFSAAAIQRREWHLLALVAVNIVVAIQVRRNKHSPSRPG